ncbi:MAG: hypothetical protein QOH61_1088 [Chloroflexota bacterium]|jgi:deazaflavin-dependent oxidoreductase (nitroreductase family)|nr:hypothetical protein [Chloroflexota bacterium]
MATDTLARDGHTSEPIQAALAQGGVIDITTRGRNSGEPRRIEIVFFNLDGRVYISGLPGPRGWYANLLADPRLTFHLKSGVQADLPARAVPVVDPATRHALLARITRQWRREAQLERFVADSPLIEVRFEDPALLAA